ncbi:2-dehydropantoate 2-reductase (Ketopantoate reductase) (KPA reductase) (KPR) [Lecanora helva]
MFKRIYILGAGNLGAFVAHSLAGIPSPPPITLLLKRRQLQYFIDRDSSIDLITRGTTETRRGFQTEQIVPFSQTFSAQEDTSPVAPNSNFSDSFDLGNNQKDQNSSLTSIAVAEKHSNEKSQTLDKIVQEHHDPSSQSYPFSDIQVNTHSPGGSRSGGAYNTDDERTLGDASLNIKDNEELSSLEDEGRQSGLQPDQDINESNKIILNLIVSVKAPHTVKAIQSVIHRINRESSILFLQNGMGIVDEVNEKLFPDESSRPTYIIGVVSHGLYSTRAFSVVHAGEGTISLGAMPHLPMTEQQDSARLTLLTASARYLLRTMTRTPVFVAVGFPPTDLLQQQLDKLAVNCIINPLTAILDCNNGALRSNTNLTRVIRLLLAEISLVIKNLPELKNVPNVEMRFDTMRLERLVFLIANATAGNNSSMLQDLRGSKPTEIDYINGYIVKRGQEMGVHCVMNYMLLHMVKGKRRITYAKGETLPFAGANTGK